MYVGCRTILPSGDFPSITFRYPPGGPDPFFPTVFNRDFTPEVLKITMTACARTLLPVLLEERLHTEQSGVIRRKRELTIRVTCDICSTALFVCSWLCTQCGREVCHLCVSDIDEPTSSAIECSGLPHMRLHRKDDFLPVSRFQDHELSEAIQAMQLLVEQDAEYKCREDELDEIPIGESGLNDPVSNEQQAPRFLPDTFGIPEFMRYCSLGIPAVVGPVKFQGTWDPDYFIQRYREQVVTIENCETGETDKITVADFFQAFIDPSRRRIGIWKLKVS